MFSAWVALGTFFTMQRWKDQGGERYWTQETFASASCRQRRKALRCV